MGILETLLEPISEDSRAGPDLDEGAEGIRAAFEADFKYATGMLERDGNGADAKSVNWGETRSEIEDLCGKTKDLRLAISYARCGIALGDVDVVECGLGFVAGLLEDYWDDFHPCGDDGPDFDYRETCFRELDAPGSFALPFFKMPIAKQGRDEISGEQIIGCYENGAASQDYDLVKRIMDGLGEESKVDLLAKLDSMVASFEKIQSIMSEHGGASAPNLSDVTQSVGGVREAFIDLAGLNVVVEESEGSEEAGSGGGSAKAFSGKIQSRDDVVKALTEIENYYNLAEPGHPVKVALARMRSWVKKDFMEILQDIVPDSVGDAKRVLMETQDSE